MEKEYKEIMDWINRNKKSNGYVTELGLKKLIKKIKNEKRI